MRVGIYDKYLDTLGGGEKFVFQIAKILSENNDVEVLGPHIEKKSVEARMGINLDNVVFKDYHDKRGILASRKLTSPYDVFLYVTDGSLFFSFAKKSYIVAQYPDQKLYNQNILTRMKLKTWSGVICYSDYVKQKIKVWWKLPIHILPPAIQTSDFKALNKENIIISVGRFFKFPHSKKQDILVLAFKKLVDLGLKNWKLKLVGGVDEKGSDFFELIKKSIEGYPIEVESNLNFTKLKNLYGKARIYWHAAGYGENLDQYPERAEHFGMTTVEAMSAEVVPVVFEAGGQREIVNNDEDGYYWNTIDDLVKKTKLLIDNNKKLNKFAKNAKLRSEDYSIANFKNRLFKILSLSRR